MNNLFLINKHSTYLSDLYITDNIDLVTCILLSAYYKRSILNLVTLFVNVMIHNGGYITLHASTIKRN